jgi:hypothetical protein
LKERAGWLHENCSRARNYISLLKPHDVSDFPFDDFPFDNDAGFALKKWAVIINDFPPASPSPVLQLPARLARLRFPQSSPRRDSQDPFI